MKSYLIGPGECNSGVLNNKEDQVFTSSLLCRYNSYSMMHSTPHNQRMVGLCTKPAKIL